LWKILFRSWALISAAYVHKKNEGLEVLVGGTGAGHQARP